MTESHDVVCYFCQGTQHVPIHAMNPRSCPYCIEGKIAVKKRTQEGPLRMSIKQTVRLSDCCHDEIITHLIKSKLSHYQCLRCGKTCNLQMTKEMGKDNIREWMRRHGVTEQHIPCSWDKTAPEGYERNTRQ